MLNESFVKIYYHTIDTKDKSEGKKHVMIEVQPEVYKKTIKKRSSGKEKENLMVRSIFLTAHSCPAFYSILLLSMNIIENGVWVQFSQQRADYQRKDKERKCLYQQNFDKLYKRATYCVRLWHILYC